MKIKDFIQDAAQRLRHLSDTPTLDAQVLAAPSLNTTRSWILAHPDAVIPPPQLENLQHKLALRLEGTPLPYILGVWEFFGSEFIVTPEVLIPRPETESLVETALSWLGSRPHPHCVLDIGTGSGCIAVSIALSDPAAQVVATDISLPALRVASKNIARHKVANQVSLICADTIPPLNSKFDLVCANLPYIPHARMTSLKVARFEPNLALDGGEDGLQVYRRLLPVLPPRLSPKSLILLEHDPEQTDALALLIEQSLPHSHIQVHPDLSGQLRMTSIQFTPP
ncbi:MAG: peptide chain release factor N(5)-glutamine methyltransferase [Chloroflexota bacterium]